MQEEQWPPYADQRNSCKGILLKCYLKLIC